MSSYLSSMQRDWVNALETMSRRCDVLVSREDNFIQFTDPNPLCFLLQQTQRDRDRDFLVHLTKILLIECCSDIKLELSPPHVKYPLDLNSRWKT